MQSSVKNLLPKSFVLYLAAILFCGLIFFLAQFTPRDETALVLSLFALLFAVSLFIAKSTKVSMPFIMMIGLLARLMTMFSLPELSDDFYRFLWDGQCSLNGINPYAYTPQELVELGKMKSSLVYELMNSPKYYSVYPAVNQYIYWLGALFSRGDYKMATLVMKVLMLLAETGSLILLFRLLSTQKNASLKFALYALNPLVILEFCGNLHAEGYMLFFVLWSFYLLQKGKSIWSAIPLAFAICLKIIPVLIVPFVLKKLGWKMGALYLSVLMAVVVLLFVPFYEPFVFVNIVKSLKLYFGVFEFNSSLYRVAQFFSIEQLWWIKAFFKVMLGAVFIWSWFKYDDKQNGISGLFKALYPVFFMYLILSQSIHPWYVLPLLVYGMFSNTFLPWIWSLLIVLTYTTYQNPENYDQNPYLIAIEYALLIGFFAFERLKPRLESTVV